MAVHIGVHLLWLAPLSVACLFALRALCAWMIRRCRREGAVGDEDIEVAEHRRARAEGEWVEW